MKLLPDTAWFSAFRAWRGRRHDRHQDPADMGTAFGLDSITVVDFDSGSAADAGGGTAVATDMQRRVARRSGL